MASPTPIPFNIGKEVGVSQAADYGFAALIGKLLGVTMTVGVLLAFLYMLWGGLLWISAHGEKGKAESARNVMTQAAIGLIVLSASIAIMVLLQAYLNVRILNFKFP